MIALILNSGVGSRMGAMTLSMPKCMTPLSGDETIISRQLRQLEAAGIKKAVITTGPFVDILQAHIEKLHPGLEIVYVHNPDYRSTNYIYSMYQARRATEGQDVLYMHGDMVMEEGLIGEFLRADRSVIAVDSTQPLPEKDFMARLEHGLVREIGVGLSGENRAASQPVYALREVDFAAWMDEIARFCERGERGVYAENALNAIAGSLALHPLELRGRLCREVDNPEDRAQVLSRLAAGRSGDMEKVKRVYMCFSAGLLHAGHMEIIQKAAALGSLTVGLLSDEAIARYKRFPPVPLAERREIFRNIKGVDDIVVQDERGYARVLDVLKPDYVVHGDTWRVGNGAELRRQVIDQLATWGGELVEFPYSSSATDDMLNSMQSMLSMPEMRRGRLRKLLEYKPFLNVLEAHNGLTGLIAEKTRVEQGGREREFDALWISSLCDSTAKGKPDIELVDMTSRLQTVEAIMEVTTKPLILDGDTGGQAEHFAFNVRTLERIGVSAIIIEDKMGLKKNSLFGTEAQQAQDSIENFTGKIVAGKKACKTRDFMIIARCESLILGRGLEDALKRCEAYARAGADGIMIHSASKSPGEVLEFCRKFREIDRGIPIVAVPSTYNSVTGAELAEAGVNIVIYANHMIRSAYPAMRGVAESILRHDRSLEADSDCIPIREILTLIPAEG